MKKTILITCFAFASVIANAQIKVYSGGKVYVGGTTTTPNSALSVGAAGNLLFKTYSYNSATTLTGANGVRGETAAPTVGGIGVYSVAGSITPGTFSTCVGVIGVAYRSTAAAGAFAYGVYGYAGNANSGNNYGVYGLLLGTNNGAGVYGSDNGATTLTAKYAAYFKGKTFCDGLLQTNNGSPEKPGGGSWAVYSDKGLKKDITPFKDGLDVIRNINPVNYKYNGIGGIDPVKPYIGVIAQDVQPVAPYCVGTSKICAKQSEAGSFNVLESIPADSSGVSKCVIEVLSFTQDGLFYAMLNSIKQLDSTVTDLQKQLSAAPLRTMGSNAGDSIRVDLSNKSIVLEQNKPNPFRDNTNITYEINTDFTTAMIIFTDIKGDVIKEVPITKKGKGTLNVYGSDLSSGIYTYNIVVDGISIDTKKMIKNK